MNLDYTVGTLEPDSADWHTLAACLGGDTHKVVQSIVRHLITLGAKSYLIESRYIDRDYSADYRRFYAQTFRTYRRHCERIHFFAEDVTKLLAASAWSDRVAALQTTSGRSYLGFCVVRPLPNASIGRTVLAQPRQPAGAGLETVVPCRATITANLLGAKLDVIGTSFMQQDARVGACAQVAIWTGARHMHARNGYNWFSVADITRLAAPITAYQATSLPAGSDFLTPDHMIRAIHEMGFQPLCIEGTDKDISDDILPYVESGLPVIVGLDAGHALGHAVTVIGRVFGAQKTPTKRLADYVPAYVVHDDQAGPYMLLPHKKNTTAYGFDPNQLISHRFAQQQISLNVEEHAKFAVVLMPTRVFGMANAAERTTLGKLQYAMDNIDQIRKDLADRKIPVNDRLMDEVVKAHKRDEIILRTYLTSASGYRRHMMQGTACEALKDLLARMHLPHFAWVTEISTVGSYNHASPGMRRMYGHSIVDATSTGKDDSCLLALHLPGVLFRWNTEKDEQVINAIPNDQLYHCREKKMT